VVREDHEQAAFKHEAEVSDGQEDSQQLPVEGAVLLLRPVQLDGEEPQRPPLLALPLLLQDCAGVGGGSVGNQRQLGAVCWKIQPACRC
jgi:hypothetical protein